MTVNKVELCGKYSEASALKKRKKKNFLSG